MKHLLLLAALTLGLAPAQAVDTKGLPAAGAGGFVHVSVRQLDQSKFGTAIDKAFGDEFRASQIFRDLKEKLGLDLEQDLQDVTLVFYPRDTAGDAAIVGVLHGRFDVPKIERFAKSGNVSSRAVGKFTAWNADELGHALDAKHDAQSKRGIPYVIPISATTLLIADADVLPAAIDAYTGAQPSFQPAAGLAARLADPVAPFLLADFDAAAMKMPADQNGLLHAWVTLGEVGPNLVLSLDATLITAGKADQIASQVKGLAGMIGLGLMDETNKSAEQIAGQRILSALLESLKAEAKGDHAVLSISYDAEKAAMGLIKAVIAQKVKAATGK